MTVAVTMHRLGRSGTDRYAGSHTETATDTGCVPIRHQARGCA